MKILCCFLLCLLLGGCASYGTEEQMMVVLLGVDQESDGNIRIIAKVPSFSAGSDGNSVSSSDGYLTLTASAADFSSALTLLHATAPRALNYSQTRQLLLSRDVLLHHTDLLYQLSHVDGMRSQTAVSVCEGKAEDVIAAEKAVVGTRLSRYIDSTLATALREGYIPDSTLIRVHTQLDNGYQDALLALTGLSDKDQQQSGEENSVQTFSQSTDGLAGNLPSTSGKSVQWMGAAAMNGRQLSGFLSGFETSLCLFLMQETREMTLETQEGTAVFTPRYGPHLSVRQAGSQTTFSIRADLNMLPKYGAQIDPSTADVLITDEILRLLSTLQSMQCDALGFGSMAVRDYLTLDDWENSRWKETYAAAQVKADIRIIRMDE